ncbi:DUF4426 domain-containing protein [Teredinibacter turnerae]|uniref:DUF4426 domain-containing protein n=1 Tax=Teredinibacter turnerae TaxID=2426 RepID=UPI00036664B7|nr:DUF4426 domain-containing protein [Teredinibacter turnerae]
MKTMISLLALFALSLSVHADVSSQASHRFGAYELHYSILPSTFIPADVAAAAGIKRSKYESLINVSVTRSGEYGGLPVTLRGTVANLMQQQKPLVFQTIEEQNAVYYLAPLRHTGEEQIHITLEATVEGGEPMNLKFTTKLYPDN